MSLGAGTTGVGIGVGALRAIGLDGAMEDTGADDTLLSRGALGATDAEGRDDAGEDDTGVGAVRESVHPARRTDPARRVRTDVRVRIGGGRFRESANLSLLLTIVK